MTTTLRFIRILFSIVSITLGVILSTTTLQSLPFAISIGIGVLAGAAFSGMLILAEQALKKVDLRVLTITVVGLFVGLLLGKGLTLLFDAAIGYEAQKASHPAILFIHAALLLISVFAAMILSARAAEEFYLSIPFVRLRPTQQQKKDILIDQSILLDARILDVAATGVFDNHLVLPRFVVNSLQTQLGDDGEGNPKIRRALEVLRKLEALPHIGLRYTDMDVPEAKDQPTRLVRLARLLDAYLLTAEISRIQQSTLEGVTVINIHSLSNALKPIMQTGETIDIKVQRYGKEALQGVGYLDDGTMVVVNGGGDYIGETIKSTVLSVKHTSSGRMIFCNVSDEEEDYSPQQYQEHLKHPSRQPATAGTGANTPRDYFTV